MEEKYSDLEPELAERLADKISQHSHEVVDLILELDKRLSHVNFLTNGGASVAVLAFIGTGADQTYAYVALMLFVLGVIATGIELRALLIFWSTLSEDIRRREKGFRANEIKVKEALTPPELGKIAKWTNHYAGWAAQLLFAGGVLVGVLGFVAHRMT